jgi:molybdopterin-guanine dinucleotide biosynthesis protein A
VLPVRDRAPAGREPPEFDAVILAGGRGARLGGADKPGLVVGAATMAATVAAAAVAAGARRVILVGPDRPDVAAVAGRLVMAREDPPGAGPVPALRAGLAQAAAPWVAVLAADLPFLTADRLRALLAAAAAGAAAGAVVADAAGTEQWLAGCWPTGRLAAALAGYQGRSLHGLLRPLRPALMADPGPAGGPSPWLDCDTPAELAAARAWRAAPGSRPGAPPPDNSQTGHNESR